MLPPKYVRAVKVRNRSQDPVEVTVTFDYHGEALGDPVEEKQVIQPNDVHFFDEKIVDMGSWTAVVPVKTLHFMDRGKMVVHHPQCDTIVDQKEFEISGPPENLAFVAI